MSGAWAFAAFLLFAQEPAGPAPESPVARAIAEQVDAWNSGDLEAALQAYCPSAEISWVNRSGLSHGFEPFARSMREQFGSDRSAMGRFDMDLLESRDLGEAGTMAVVRWSIIRDGTRLMGGVSSQLWAECQGRLRVVFEHAS